MLLAKIFNRSSVLILAIPLTLLYLLKYHDQNIHHVECTGYRDSQTSEERTSACF